jgi:hypothetical protein
MTNLDSKFPGSCGILVMGRHIKSVVTSWMWWETPVIPALGRLRQKDQEASLGYIGRHCTPLPKKIKV